MIITISISLAACTSTTLENTESKSDPVQYEEMKVSDAQLLGQTNDLSLYFENGGIKVENRKNASKWYSSVNAGEYNTEKMNKLWKANSKSLIGVNYSQSRQSVQILSTNPILSDAKESYYKINNGIRITYNFTDIKIKISLNIFVENDQLVFQIPKEDIEEYGSCILASVEVMQFMGCASDKNDGYFLIPDGSGALFHFSQLETKILSTKQYEWTLYGSDSDYLKKNSIDTSEYGKFFLPVFGVKKDAYGFAAIVTKGSEDCSINLYTAASAIKLNRICAEFVYRRTYDITVTAIKDGTTETRSDFTNIDDTIISSDREIRYLFPERECTYSEMANISRDYLQNSGVLVDKIPDNETMPLGVDFFVGIQSSGILSEYYLMTGYSDCAAILEKLSSDGVKNMQTTLQGWEKGGYGNFPAVYTLESKAGGTAGLKALSAAAKKTNTKLFLTVNYIDVVRKSGYSQRKDLIRNKSNTVIGSEDNKYLLTATSAYNRLKNDLKKIGQGIDGLSFEGFGETLYSDYQHTNVTEREKTAGIWNSLLGLSDEKLGAAGSYGGNMFLLSRTDRLYDIPYDHSGFSIEDQSVPFFQMIVHGNIAYSTTPANLFYDSDYQTLKLLEYGYMPYFMLTKEQSFRLKDTKYNMLFTSYYKNYLDKAVSMYKMFEGSVGKCWSCNMTGHEEVASGVFQTDYSNGVSIYVNYNKTDAVIGNIRVLAMNYAVSEGS